VADFVAGELPVQNTATNDINNTKYFIEIAFKNAARRQAARIPAGRASPSETTYQIAQLLLACER
jgi:hypothetical protein